MTAKILTFSDGMFGDRKEVLTPESPRWEQFTDMLDSMEWCDGDAGPNVHRHAKAIMAAMGGIDIEASLAFFEDHGGYCDCEILLNVEHRHYCNTKGN